MTTTANPTYVIIGAGRVASHFTHYFNLLKLPFNNWSRAQDPAGKDLSTLVQGDVRVLLAIKDSAIEEFVSMHPCLHGKLCLHLSGHLSTPLAYGAHPLFTFGSDLYELSAYQHIPFILETGGPSFETLLPGLKNQHYTIDKSLKPLYHSLCVLSGNFSCLLWQKFFSELEKTLHLPKEVAFSYLQQIANNLQKDSESALTGPLVRGDKVTIATNLKALEGDPFQGVYQAFVDMYEKTKQK